MRVILPDIQAFAPNVWIVDGPRVRDMGLFTTRMTIVKLYDGSLWVDSPVPSVRDAHRHHRTGTGALSCRRDPQARLASGKMAHALSRSPALGITPHTVYVEEGHLPLTGTSETRRIPPGPKTSTNLPSKAAPSSRKSYSCIERPARSSWMISSSSIRA